MFKTSLVSRIAQILFLIKVGFSNTRGNTQQVKGEADHDGDGIITVSELFSYISREVPEASGQDQHPVRKGETEGEFVIGRVK